jgi:predicted lipid-binding transport protein (Tim44 family)
MLFSFLIAQGKGGAYGAGQTVGTIFLVILVLAIVVKVIGGVSSRGGYTPAKSTIHYDAGPLKKRRKEPSAPVLAKSDVALKAKATSDLLRLVNDGDQWFEPGYLKEAAKEVFTFLQDGWDNKDFEHLKGYWTAECRDIYLDRYEDPPTRKKMARLNDYDLSRVEHVHFKATGPEGQHTFTVLLTAQGDQKWQEFWTFVRTPKRWKLARMRSTKSVDILSDANEVPLAVARKVKADANAKGLMRYITQE